MSKYSSESDSSERSSRYPRKSKRKSASSSYSSDDSMNLSKKKTHKHKRSKSHRSRSRDRYSKSRARYSRDDVSRSSTGSYSSRSTSRKLSRGRSRSNSREKFRSRGRHRSTKSSRSPSKSRSKYRSSSSSSVDEIGSKSNSSLSMDVHASQVSKQEPSSEEQLKAKLQQAIKAAQSADDMLRQQGFLTGTSSRKDEVKEPPVNILDEINSPNFVPKNFVSQSSANLYSNTGSTLALKASDVQPQMSAQEFKNGTSSIFHPSLLADSDQKLDKWVKKLFNLRQKAINGEPIV